MGVGRHWSWSKGGREALVKGQSAPDPCARREAPAGESEEPRAAPHVTFRAARGCEIKCKTPQTQRHWYHACEYRVAGAQARSVADSGGCTVGDSGAGTAWLIRRSRYSVAATIADSIAAMT
eukprot:3381976-Rhodomonas_salina.1